jgi:transposase
LTDLNQTAVAAYQKTLADIERGFQVLNDELEIGPIYHRVPKFIQANVTICFIALIIQRIILHKLKVARTLMSPQQALQTPATFQRNHAPRYEYPREHSTICPDHRASTKH